MQAAASTFLVTLDSHKWVQLPSASSRGRRGSPEGPAGSHQGRPGDSGPPYSLMDHAPLALLTNGLLGAFNELRHCAPMSLKGPVAGVTQVGA